MPGVPTGELTLVPRTTISGDRVIYRLVVTTSQGNGGEPEVVLGAVGRSPVDTVQALFDYRHPLTSSVYERVTKARAA